ncbi:protein of unknown function - conserved [Leishmania donovani]|uniref:Hypothetical_protein_conserved n=1 Tax=Leishmania donovani TaxID=5661 RepID=A0A3S7XAU2_LEIDO|nr:hypothetical protein, unknown function [Leishmania donovani]AYU83587.1 hypothetical protein LdCL_360029700 [Leishmania donovani]TPP42212.1 hypothetical protein CGC20_28770 [Leishmania donovani]TPP48348.1 hypothetical protein CGC21_13490 [Leishmania donovani]CAJ1993601.1 protein of unknown function - conserved [Leishmania donovani]CBZ38678.1 hypothetical protein, unknown function [Leishmania donovani]
MAEAKVVKDLAEVCARGEETYSVWTTAKALVQRRYLSAKAQGTFEDCGKLLVSLTQVLRTYLRIDLAQELLRDMLFQVMERFSAKQAAGATAAIVKDGGAPHSSFDLAAANFLQHVFDTLLSATTRTYTLMGPMPLVVEWNRDADSGGVDAVVAQSKHAASWAEDVVLEFAARAADFLSQRLQSADVLSRWAQNLFVSYEQLLALRLALPSSPPSTPQDGKAASTAAPSPSVPVPTLAAQLLRMSIFSRASRTGKESSDSPSAATTPLTAAVHWLTHFAREPNAVNHLFAQYVYFDILGRGQQRSSTTNTAPGNSGAPAKMPLERVNAALEERCALTRREAIYMARAAVEAYWQAFPLVLKQTSSASSRQLSSCVEESGKEDANVDPQYVHLYRWTWFLDSLTLTFAYSGSASAGANEDAAAQQRERQKHVCAQLLETYADVAAELPGLKWKELIAAYIGP